MSDLLSCEARSNDIVKSFTKESLEEKNTNFFVAINRNKLKMFASLYKSSTTERTKRSKVLKADKKILQQLLNVSNSGQDVQIAGVLKYKLSPVPLSLANSSV